MYVRVIRRTWSMFIVAALLGLAALLTISMARADSHVIASGDVVGLIAAIEAANVSEDPTTIVLAQDGEYILSAENNPDNGLPVITRQVTIEGNGATIRRSGVADTPGFRIFEVQHASGQLHLDGLTVSGGHAPFGGGISISDAGTVTLTNSTVSDNIADGHSGGIDIDGGALTLTNSTVSGNTAGFNTASFSGGGIRNWGGAVALTNSIVSGNTAGFGGGGITNANSGVVELTNSTVSDNESHNRGGGIRNDDAVLTLTNSTIGGNTGGFGGGGIYNNDSGLVEVTGSTVSGNSVASFGGGIYNSNSGLVELTNSTVSDNEARLEGGGIYNSGAALTLTNSTISGNSASEGSTFYPLGGGGGIRNNFGPVTLTGTLVAVNTAANLGNDINGTVTGTVNLIGDGDGMVGLTDVYDGNQVGTSAEPIDPMLGSLQNNGGLTETMALLDGSPALNYIPVAACTVANDQRGVERPQGDNCDIGAFEQEVAILPPPVDPLDFACVDGFGNMFFERNWERTDLPVIDHGVLRTWMWGECAFTDILREPYAESPGGEREIIYLDKARMEINDPGADPDELWYVTNGLLVKEMISGMRQLGDTTFDDYGSADVNVAGDANDPDGPTYTSFAGLLNEPAQPVGTLLNQQVDRAGNVSVNPAFDAHGVAVGYVDEVTSHGIAGPFWEFMNSQGLVYANGALHTQALFENPFYATGRPVTEAYWATVLVASQPREVLMQCFERRCLTYTPGNPEGFVVEAGNVGQHYYAWRYFHAPDQP